MAKRLYPPYLRMRKNPLDKRRRELTPSAARLPVTPEHDCQGDLVSVGFHADDADDVGRTAIETDSLIFRRCVLVRANQFGGVVNGFVYGETHVAHDIVIASQREQAGTFPRVDIADDKAT